MFCIIVVFPVPIADFIANVFTELSFNHYLIHSFGFVSIFPSNIKEWLNDKSVKTLAIKSAMGTGKTTIIQKILEYDMSLNKYYGLPIVKH
jgi:hypothetical protein